MAFASLAVKTLVTDIIHFGERFGDWSTEAAIGLVKPTVTIPVLETSDKLEGNGKWRKSIVEGLEANFPAGVVPRAPLAVPATVISSNILIRDPDLAERWAIHARAAKAVEMEIAGALRAADAIGDANLPILTIRGISDVIGYKRDPAWTNYACQSAGAFTFGLLKSGFIKRAAE
jgi:nucleoside phosphorylase